MKLLHQPAILFLSVAVCQPENVNNVDTNRDGGNNENIAETLKQDEIGGPPKIEVIAPETSSASLTNQAAANKAVDQTFTVSGKLPVAETLTDAEEAEKEGAASATSLTEDKLSKEDEVGLERPEELQEESELTRADHEALNSVQQAAPAETSPAETSPAETSPAETSAAETLTSVQQAAPAETSQAETLAAETAAAAATAAVEIPAAATSAAATSAAATSATPTPAVIKVSENDVAVLNEGIGVNNNGNSNGNSNINENNNESVPVSSPDTNQIVVPDVSLEQNVDELLESTNDTGNGFEALSTEDSGADMSTIIGAVIGVAVAAIAVIAMLVARKKNSKENEKEIYLAQNDPYHIQASSSVMAAPMLHPTFEQHPPTERITEGYHVRELSISDSSSMSFSDYNSDFNDSMMSGSEFSCKNSQVNDQNSEFHSVLKVPTATAALPAHSLGAMYYVDKSMEQISDAKESESQNESFIEEEELAASEYDESEVVDGESIRSSEYEESELDQEESIYSDVDECFDFQSIASNSEIGDESIIDRDSELSANDDDQEHSQYSESECGQSEAASEDDASDWGDSSSTAFESEFDDEESNDAYSDNGSVISNDWEMAL